MRELEFERQAVVDIRRCMWVMARHRRAGLAQVRPAAATLEEAARDVVRRLEREPPDSTSDSDMRRALFALANEAASCHARGLRDGAAGRLAHAYRDLLATLERRVTVRTESLMQEENHG
jgi:hypothetical protein